MVFSAKKGRREMGVPCQGTLGDRTASLLKRKSPMLCALAESELLMPVGGAEET